MLELTVSRSFQSTCRFQTTPVNFARRRRKSAGFGCRTRFKSAPFRNMLPQLEGEELKDAADTVPWEVAQQQTPRRQWEPLLSLSQERRLTCFYTTARIRIAAVMASTGLQTAVVTREPEIDRDYIYQ
jgi:hypothetical protein